MATFRPHPPCATSSGRKPFPPPPFSAPLTSAPSTAFPPCSRWRGSLEGSSSKTPMPGSIRSIV
ncbi:hypothetical protein F2P46_10725 [Massilia sp. CCM 8734]|nr:hypothetical protein [Massilia sp. CCM 8734]